MSIQYFNKSNILSTNPLNTSYYRHVALTISGTTHTLYLDGSAVATNTNAFNIFQNYPSTISKLFIGSAADLSYGFSGLIDDFKVFNRALPASDISSIYYAIPTTYGLLFYYSFDLLSTSVTELVSNTTLVLSNWGPGAFINTTNNYVGNGCLDCTNNTYFGSISFPITYVVNNTMTISLWLYLTVQPDSNTPQCYFQVGLNSIALWLQNCSNFANGTYDNNIYINTYNFGAIFNQLVITSPSLNTWYNIVISITGNGQYFTVYVNNVISVNNVSTNYTGAINNKTYSKFTLGTNEGGSNIANCLIDDFRIYNRTLNISELTTIYNFHK